MTAHPRGRVLAPELPARVAEGRQEQLGEEVVPEAKYVYAVAGTPRPGPPPCGLSRASCPTARSSCPCRPGKTSRRSPRLTGVEAHPGKSQTLDWTPVQGTPGPQFHAIAGIGGVWRRSAEPTVALNGRAGGGHHPARADLVLLAEPLRRHSGRTHFGRSRPWGSCWFTSPGPRGADPGGARTAGGESRNRRGARGVPVFLAGDAVQARSAMRSSTRSRASARALPARVLRRDRPAGGGRFYASGMSSKARGVVEGDLEGKPVEFAMPNRLVQLAFEADRTFTY